MKNLAVFDFDGTIYKKDSLIEFYKFVILKNPWRIIFIFVQILAYLLYFFKIINTKKYKELFLIYLLGINKKLDYLVNDFWQKEFPVNFNKSVLDLLNKYSYLEIVCITASPDFMFKHLGNKLNINTFISTITIINKNRLIINGENCRGIEKIKRLNKLYPNGYNLEFAISDNLDDKPLVLMAKNGFFIKNNKIQLIHEN